MQHNGLVCYLHAQPRRAYRLFEIAYPVYMLPEFDKDWTFTTLSLKPVTHRSYGTGVGLNTRQDLNRR
jgi:hypothetical protein